MTPMADRLIEIVISTEGGLKLTDTKNDKGGQTYAGISRKFWPKWEGWELVDNGEKPGMGMVKGFYYENFWKPLGLDQIQSEWKAEAILDCGVLFGVRGTAYWVQKVTWVKQDGELGPKTAAAVNAMNEGLFLAQLALARIGDHTNTVLRDKSQAKFYAGWVARALDRSGIRWR